MFVGHLPAGYLISRTRLFSSSVLRRSSCLGAVLPDVDMLWFHLVDKGAVHHHAYLTHKPIVWLIIALVGVTAFPRHPWVWSLGLGGVLHVALDSIVGAVTWGWPMSTRALTLIDVPATHDWWVMSFLTHWTFMVEVLICLAAVWVWSRESVTKKAPAKPGPS